MVGWTPVADETVIAIDQRIMELNVLLLGSDRSHDRCRSDVIPRCDLPEAEKPKIRMPCA
jgi:hypothetical protein